VSAVSVTGDVAVVERRAAELAGAPPVRRVVTDPDPSSGSTFEVAVSRALDTLVVRAADAARGDPSLVRAVARTESNFDPTARSAAGAEGVMQLMPATAQALGVANPYDPAQNVRGGALYLRELLDRFGGDVSRAVAAYNAGPGAVERAGGIPPFPETRRYVERVMAAYRADRENRPNRL
jgi:soluble lytic murein transglycosylase-like protein